MHKLAQFWSMWAPWVTPFNSLCDPVNGSWAAFNLLSGVGFRGGGGVSDSVEVTVAAEFDENEENSPATGLVTVRSPSEEEQELLSQ